MTKMAILPTCSLLQVEHYLTGNPGNIDCIHKVMYNSDVNVLYST